MLPSVVEIAKEQGLIFNPSARSRWGVEVTCKCPFCEEDTKPGKQRRYYLSLNSKDQVFKCWFCKESGGVFRFISLLEGVPEEEVRKRYRKRKILHPAEQLSRNQRRLAQEWNGIATDPDWRKMRERDSAYYVRTLEHLWVEWYAFLYQEYKDAYYNLLMGIRFKRYSEYVEKIKKREAEIEAPLLKPICEVYSMPLRPTWATEVEDFINRHSQIGKP